MSTYTPAPGSLAARVCDFFRRNREEELTTSELSRKFDVPTGSVANGLAACLTHKLLNRQRDDDKQLVWLAGENLASVAPPPSSLTGLLKAGHTAPGRKPRVPLPELDVEALVVRDDVPIPERTRGNGERSSFYARVFDKLERVGQSTVVPVVHRKAISSAAKTYGKRTGRKFNFRLVDVQTLGIWRME